MLAIIDNRENPRWTAFLMNAVDANDSIYCFQPWHMCQPRWGRRDRRGIGRLAAGKENGDFPIAAMALRSDLKTGVQTLAAFRQSFHATSRQSASRQQGDGQYPHQAGDGHRHRRGMDDNVMHAVATIAELDRLPHTHQHAGLEPGRGDVHETGVQAARILPANLAVNIFAVDPVAGVGCW